MEVKNAGEASEIVKEFLRKFGWDILVSPIRAERKDGTWAVELFEGFRPMTFEINALTGEIVRYYQKS